MKIEIEPDVKVPRHTTDKITKMLATLPPDHLRGITRLKIVRRIVYQQSKNTASQNLPGLYHPRQGATPAWMEIATDFLLSPDAKLARRLTARLSFYSNLSFLLFSLVGQHHFLTMKHSVKRHQIEKSVRLYTEQYAKAWHEREHTFRTRLFKPLQPKLEQWAKSLQRHLKSVAQ